MDLVMLAAMWVLLRTRIRSRSVDIALDALVVGLTVGGVAVPAAVPDARRHRRSQSDPGQMVATNLAYPILDIATLVIVTGALVRLGWRSWSTALLAAGIAAEAIVDAVFVYQASAGTYHPGMFLAALSLMATAAIAFAGWAPEGEQRETPGYEFSRVAVTAALGLIAVAALVYAALGDVPVGGVVLLAAALVVGIGRAMYTVARNRGTAESAISAKNAELVRFQSLVETSDDFIAMARPDGRMMYVNPAGRTAGGHRRTRREPDDHRGLPDRGGSGHLGRGRAAGRRPARSLVRAVHAARPPRRAADPGRDLELPDARPGDRGPVRAGHRAARHLRPGGRAVRLSSGSPTSGSTCSTAWCRPRRTSAPGSRPTSTTTRCRPSPPSSSGSACYAVSSGTTDPSCARRPRPWPAPCARRSGGCAPCSSTSSRRRSGTDLATALGVAAEDAFEDRIRLAGHRRAPTWTCREGLRVTAYRIAREAMSNVVRHADAREVVIRLSRVGSGVEVAVEDDGRGFDPVAVEPRPGHLGIPAMADRATIAGGRLEVERRDEGGTRVRLWLPSPLGRTTGRTWRAPSDRTGGTWVRRSPLRVLREARRPASRGERRRAGALVGRRSDRPRAPTCGDRGQDRCRLTGGGQRLPDRSR